MRNHHENAAIDDLRTTRLPWRLDNLLLSLLAIGVVLGLYMVAAGMDDRAEEREIAYALAARERLAMPSKVAQAYERGLTDAIDALRDTPDGVALAQACMAAGSR